METLTPEAFEALLKRAGLDPTEQDKEKLRALFESFLPRLEALHAADLDDEEVASIFTPQWS